MFSVVIPAYNKEKTISKVLDSVRCQTRIDLIDEIIIVNDGSTDRTEQVVHNYRKNHPMNKEKLKYSKSKFANALVENDEDNYSKGLKKVNQLNKNDGFIYKVISALYGQLKSIKRNKSCVTFGKFQRKIDMTEFYNTTEKEKFFGDDLEDEQKITLSNTLFNKIRKEVIEE